MCTVSIVSGTAENGEHFVRVACNRDELRSRPSALRPVQRRFGNNCALFPIDPLGGGTWIAASSAGLGFVVLNLNDASAANRVGQLSRGLIIPRLLSAKNLDETTSRVARLEAAQFASFRLIILDDQRIIEFVSAGEAVELRSCSELERPAFFTSSGLGDHLVDGPRRDVFRQFLASGPMNRRQQDALHQHAWPDRPHLSICMNRSDAQTVSYSTLEIGRARVTLDYVAGAPGTNAKSWSVSAIREPFQVQ